MSSIPNPSAIAKVPEATHRPKWSVMIPTFNCANYLCQTLESVLSQYPGPKQMQIEVVDDCSTKDNPEEVVREVGKGRVQFHRKPKNAGAIANFNTCIERSRGELVHILHGDDWVSQGFYAAVEAAAENHPEVSAIFARSFITNADGVISGVSGQLDHLQAPSKNYGSMLYGNDIRTPGVVVRRTFYECHGGFCPELVHVADWEMWLRVIRLEGAISLSDVLAYYRFFPDNDTGKLAKTAENLRDYLRLAEFLSASDPDFNYNRFRRIVSFKADEQRKRFETLGDHDATVANRNLWLELNPPTPWYRKLAAAVRAFKNSLKSR